MNDKAMLSDDTVIDDTVIDDKMNDNTLNNNTILEFQDVSKIYKMGDEEVHALESVNLAIQKGSFTAIMGPSGSGKSTLLHVAGILDMPTKGTVLINKKKTSDLSQKKQSLLRRMEIGFVFQRLNLLPQLSALENVMLPMFNPDEVKAKEILESMGLGDKYSRLPGQLSGGEQQRVAIARALINQPSLILADEPTGELDTNNTRIIMEQLKKLNREGLTIIIVTHNQIAAEFVDNVIEMRDGNII